jgi:hypothetical protein
MTFMRLPPLSVTDEDRVVLESTTSGRMRRHSTAVRGDEWSGIELTSELDIMESCFYSRVYAEPS